MLTGSPNAVELRSSFSFITSWESFFWDFLRSLGLLCSVGSVSDRSAFRDMGSPNVLGFFLILEDARSASDGGHFQCFWLV
jgi:hypothetical protein